MPAPVIQSTTFGSIRIAVLACPGCTVQVFNSRVPDGEGEFYLGGGPADAAGAYTLVVDSLAYPYSDGHRHRGPGHFGIFGGLHLDRLHPEPAHDSAVTGRPSVG